jgi:hypothetical protein
VSSGVISDGFLHEDVDVDADTTEMQSSFLQESEEALIGGPFSAAGLAANKIKVKKTCLLDISHVPIIPPHYIILYTSRPCLVSFGVKHV